MGNYSIMDVANKITRRSWRKALLNGILAIVAVWIFLAIIFSRMPNVGSHALRMKARTEIADLVTDIEAYEKQYGRLPIQIAITNRDLTFGISPNHISGYQPTAGTQLITSNSDLMVVLTDFNTGVNAGHQLNPQQTKFLDAHKVDDTNSPGFSLIDHEYRDPWGHPYIISVDANHDGFVCDAFYANAHLYNNNTNAEPLMYRSGFFELRGTVMVWSRGPDGQASAAKPAIESVNKDNLRSWQ